MANLLEVAQSVYDQIFPNASAQTSVKVDHVIVESKSRYAYEMYLMNKNLARSEGEWEIPSALWREATLDIKNNEADISSLNIFRSFDGDTWIGSIGDGCDCSYMRLTMNTKNIFCDDEYIGNSKTYYIAGKKIKFPQGAHAKTIPITYASNGMDVDSEIEVDDAIAALVSDYLWKRFANRLPEDRTNNSNSNV